MPLRVASIISLLLVCIGTAEAHFPQNLGIEEPGDPFPVLRDAPPMATQEQQVMALDMEHADCEELMALPQEVKDAFLVLHMSLQRPGSLSRLIGPKCTYMGGAQEIALISDPNLTLGEEWESLYYLSDAHVLLVTDKENDSVAYGMSYHGDEPVEYFLSHREDAEESAAIARIFKQNVPVVNLSNITEVVRTSVASASSTQSTRSVRQRSSVSAESTTTSSAAAVVPGTEPPAPGVPGFEAGTSSLGGAINTSSAPAVLEGGSVSAVPNIEPLGPEPEPEPTGSSTTMIIILIVFALVTAVLIVVYLKTRSSPEQGYADDQ